MADIRTFIAIKIEFTPQVHEIFNSFKNELTSETIRWVNPENFHITLKFIGNTDERKIALITKHLANVAEKISPFFLSVSGCGVFPNSKRLKVIWLGLRYPDALIKLKTEIEQQLQFVVPKDEKPFKAHLTIGRAKKNVANSETLVRLLKRWANTRFEEMEIRDFVLMQSRLTPQGAEYKVLEKFCLYNAE